jgi:hypothetical protein
VLMNSPSIPAFQLLEQKYWDKSLFFTVDSVQNQKAVQIIRPAENHEGIRPLFSLGQIDVIFALLLLYFLFSTRIYKSGILFFKENISFVYSTRKNINQLNETTATDSWYNLILLFRFVLLLAITLFAVFHRQDNDYIPFHGFLLVLSLVLGVVLAGWVKYLFYRLVGFIFDIRDAIRTWFRSYVIMLEMMGLIAFIPVLFLVYSNYYHELLINFLIGLFIVSRLIIIYRIGFFFIRRKVNILFLIAYLCSVEIIPYFVLYRGLLYLCNIDITSLSLLWL